MTVMSRVAFFRRFDLDGVPVDRVWCPIDAKGCDTLALVWAGRLKSGEYNRIEFMLANGQFVTVRGLSERRKTNLANKHWANRHLRLSDPYSELFDEEENRFNCRNSR